MVLSLLAYMKKLILMRHLFVTLVLVCMTICSYAQRDIRVSDYTEIASVENCYVIVLFV